MRVAEVTAFGAPDVLQSAERPDPVPAPGEVLVRIRAASVNPTDLAARSVGSAYIHGLEPPFVPGWDLAGEVTALGDGVTSFSVGDRVCGMIPFARIGGRVGAYAQLAAVQPDWLTPIADTLSFDDAATLPLNALTAHQALEHFDLSPGLRLLVTGASGGVGGFAVSLAVRGGLSVIAIAGRDDEAWVRSLGATTVLPRDADLGAIAPVDGVLDAVPVGAERSAAALRSGCTAVFTRPPTSPAADGNRYEMVRVQSDPTTLREMAALLAAGVLRTRVARVLPLDGAAEAHRLVERGGLHGKVILRP